MEGGNAQKSEKAKAAGKGSQIESNKNAMPFQCTVCLRTFISEKKCREHKANHTSKLSDAMEGGNAQKLEKAKAAGKGSQLEPYKYARPFQCTVCLRTFISEKKCREHKANHTSKLSDGTAYFPHLKN